ncbi:hypothetical protein HDV05_008550 [Chytridiales sp. JEL 0842]|nr:hypothetical protein HDV05_008550 [Chytridiales sp. JEL 0842]
MSTAPPSKPKRLTLTPLRLIEQSDSPSNHLDNVRAVQYISDAQQRWFVEALRKEEGWGETVNGDLQVVYLSQGKPYENVRVEVGLMSVSRVSFRLSVRIQGSDHRTIALAEIGTVKIGEDGRAEEIRGGFREALEREMERQAQGLEGWARV